MSFRPSHPVVDGLGGDAEAAGRQAEVPSALPQGQEDLAKDDLVQGEEVFPFPPGGGFQPGAEQTGIDGNGTRDEITAFHQLLQGAHVPGEIRGGGEEGTGGRREVAGGGSQAAGGTA